MFLSSWLESFKEVVCLSPRGTGGRLRKHRRPTRPQSSETLETRALLATNFQFPSPLGTPIQPVQISHFSSVVGEPNFSFLAQDKPNVLDPTQIRLGLGFGNNFSTITASSNDVNIVQSHDVTNSPGLDISYENGFLTNSPFAYIRFSAGSALFGATTVHVSAPSFGFAPPTTLDIPVWLNDVPSINPLQNISIPEDTPLLSIPLNGITAGGGADDPASGGQNRIIYASTTQPFLTGIPLVQYNAGPMDQIGRLLIHPAKGAPVSIVNQGDNEATITVTIEDAGVDNIVGKSYDATTGKVSITNYDATLDNIVRSQTFRLTIVPVNNDPTIDDIHTAITTTSALVQSADLTISVADATQFPPTASPNFTIEVGTERMRVTNVAGTTFSVTRGVDGTSATSHFSGARVTLIDDVVRLEDTPPGPAVLDADLKTIIDLQGNTVVNLTGITPGGGTSAIGNEQQQIGIASLSLPAQPVNTGFFTLTFDNGSQSFTTDLIPRDAPATVSRDETLTMKTSGSGGTFTMTLADDKGEETSLDSAIGTALPGATSIFSVDDLNGFRSTVPFVISVGSSIVGTLTSSLSAIATSFTLTNPTSLPATPFSIRVEQEQMDVTAVLGNTLTVTRGVNGTAAVVHNGSLAVPINVGGDFAEEMRVTAVADTPVSGNPNRKTLTVTRGYHGTLPAAHADYATVIEQRVTQLNQPPAGVGVPASSPTTADISDVDLTVKVQNGGLFPTIAADSLKADVTLTDTLITLNDVTPFTPPALTTPFKIQIGTEVMVVTNVDTVNNQFTVVRAQDFTTATTHVANDSVVNPFTILVNQEQMRVTKVAGNTLTVLRGVNGTTAVAHGDGITVGQFPKATVIDDTLTVVDSALFPTLTTAVPFFDVRINNEDMRVTFVSGNQLLVLRGIHATAITAHADGEQVSRIYTTGQIAYNATASEVQSKLEGLPIVGQGNVQVTGGPISANTNVTIQFVNQLGKLNLDNLTADISGVTGNEKQQLGMSGQNFTGSGQYTLTFNGATTAPIDIAADAAQVQLALEALNNVNPGDVKVTGGPLPGTPFIVEFLGQYANTNVNPITAISFPNPPSTGLQNNERQQITMFGFPTGGNFTLVYRDQGGTNRTTNPIVFDAADPTGINTGDNIKTALEAVTNGPTVNVTAVSFTSWIIQFTTPADVNIAPLVVGAKNGPLAAVVINITTIEDGNQSIVNVNAATVAGLKPAATVTETISGALSIYDALSDLPSMTLADAKTSGGSLPGLPVTVEFVGKYAGLVMPGLTVNDSPLPLFGLSDALATASITNLPRRFDGETQQLSVMATSDNPDVVPNPTVVYSSPAQIAQLLITNNTDAFGDANITLTISDSGFDQNLSTTNDNKFITKTFHVRVLPTNDLPTITPMPDLSRPKNSSPIPLTIKGISAGGRETQDLRVTAVSSNTALLPNPSVVYSNGAVTAQMNLVPTTGQTGSAIVTVTVEDAGVDGILNSTGDNGKRQISFRFDVSELPTLGPTPATVTILEDALATPMLQPLGLTGITAGGAENQALQLSVSNTNTGLFTPANLNVAYVSAATTGTLNFTPTPQLSGNDTFRLTLVDAGPDRQLGFAGQLTADSTTTATLISVINAASYPAIPTDKLAAPVLLTDTTVTLVDATTFPSTFNPFRAPFNPLDPTTYFKIQIGNEVMTVTNITGVGPSKTFTVIRAEDGSAVAAHAANDRVVEPFKIQIGTELLRVTAITGNNLNVVRGIDGTAATAHQVLDPVVHPYALDNLAITRDIAVQVTPVNDKPTLDVIKPNPLSPGNLTIPQGSGEQIISLSGITDGEGAGARQHLRIAATSTNPTLTGTITVVYNDGDPAGSIRFTPTSNLSGSAGITVTVFDGGSDNNLNTLEADFSDQFSRTLNVTVVPIGQAPTINSIANTTINEDSPLQPINLGGISDNDSNTQDLSVIVSTTDTNLSSNLTLNYNPSNLQPSTGGAPPTTGTLTFVPGANRFGSASITVTVTDGGTDGRLGFDSLANSPTASLLDTTVKVTNPTRFPSTPGFHIFIDNEEMIVNSIAGSTFTVTRAVNSTPLQAHTAGALVTAPNTIADNVSTSRTFNVTVNPVNDPPTITTINGVNVVALPSITLPAISEGAPLQTINLAGIGPGPFESQKVSVKVTSDNTGLIQPTAHYNDGDTTGTITFQPTAYKFGTATLTVTITDAGQDGNLDTLTDNGVTVKKIVVNVNAVNDAPTVDAVNPVPVLEESGEKSVNLTGITAGGGESQILKVTAAVVAGSESIAGLITNVALDYTSPNSTGVLRFTPAAGLFGTAKIRVTVEDAGFDGVLSNTGDNATFFRDININVTNVADLPTLAQPPAASINKSGYLVNSVTVTGISDGDLNTQALTVTATSDNLALIPNPIVNFTQSGVSPSTALQSAVLIFTPTPNQLGTANITVKVADGLTSFVTKTFTLTVVDVNLPPTVNAPLPNPIMLVEDGGTTPWISLFGITAGGTESQVLKVTAVSSDPNAIFIDNNADVFYSSPSPNGAVLIHPQPNAAGNFTVTITVTDAGSDGIFGNANDNSTSTTVNVQIAQGNNDPPTLAAIANKITAKSGSPTLQTVNLSGISAGPYEIANVSVTASVLSDPSGIITGLAVTSPTLPGTTSTDSVTFTPTANVSGTAQIQVQVSDGVNAPVSRTFFVYVINPPTITSLSNPAPVAEDTVSPPTILITGLGDGDAGTEGGTLTVTSSNQALISNATLSLSNTSLPFGTPTLGTSTLSYTLNLDANGTTVITLTATDNGPDHMPGTGDEAIVTTSFTITVTPVNDIPTLTAPLTLTLTEDGANGTISLSNIFAKVGALLDEANQPLRITAVSADLSKVAISSVNYTSPNSTGSVVVAPMPDAFTALGSPVKVTITVEDGGTDNNLSTSGDNQTYSQVVAVSITPVNDKPTLNAINDVTVNEDTGMTPVSLSGITAGPGETQTLSVSATSDNQFLIPDGNLSVIYTSANPAGTLQFTPLPNKYGDAFITVTVTDDGTAGGAAQSFSQTFKIHVSRVNDAPVINGLLGAPDYAAVVSGGGLIGTIDENLPVGTEVAAVDFDDDSPLSVLNVSILSGNTDNAFSIAPDGTIKVANAKAIDFEKNPVFNLVVKIVDNDPTGPIGLVATKAFTIQLNDLTEVLMIGAGNWPASGGLTLKRTVDGKIHVLNSSNADVLPANVFANVSKVQVTGRSGTADVLTLDYTGGDPVPVGVTGGLTFEGGAGVGDAIKFANAAFNQLNTTFSSSTSANIVDPGNAFGSIGLQGIEGINFGSTVTATNLKFVYGSGNDFVTFADDSGAANGVSNFSSSSSPLVTFPATAGVTIDLGDGNNSVRFDSIENAAGPAVTVLGGSGRDIMDASRVGRSVSFSGGAGNDFLLGSSGVDTIQGGGDEDTLSGGAGNDNLDGGTGFNTLFETSDTNFSVGAGTTSGGIGVDSFTNIQLASLTGGAGSNVISAAGFGGTAVINGGGGNDTLTGSSQDDRITGGAGSDSIDGGGGNDTLVESGNVDFTLSASTLTSGVDVDNFTNVEFAVLTGGFGNNKLDASNFLGSVTLSGGAGNDVLKGGAGNDSLFGEAGNDTLTGNGGTNGLFGGTETDQVFASGNVDFTLTPTQLTSSLGTDNLTSIETAKLVGGGGDNTLDASAFTGLTTLQGGDGADKLIGGSNVDSMEGGNGDDVLTGGAGNDKFIGGSGVDTILEANVTKISLTATSMTGTGRGTDSLSSMERASLTGTSGNDTISGGTFAGAMDIEGFGGADSLTGGNGNDTILGGDGNDTLTGGAGNDFIRGGENNDKIFGGDGNDSLDGGNGNDTISGEAGNDVILGGEGNDSLSGGNDNDAIDGQGGDDTVYGDSGNDTLIGGTGKDSINGGSGNDLLWGGDYHSDSVNPADGDKDILISGTGTDVVKGETGSADFDTMTDASNTAAEKAAAFIFGYDSIFAALL